MADGTKHGVKQAEGTVCIHVQSALFAGCKSGEVEAVRKALEGGASVHLSINVNAHGMQPIHYACVYGHSTVVQLLLKYDAAVDACDETGSQPIHCASAFNRIATVQCLVELGAAVDVRDGDGGQPIHRACVRGHTATVRCLVELGAAVDARDNNGRQPIHLASAQGHTATVRYLVELGAVADTIALQHALDGAHDEVLQQPCRHKKIALCTSRTHIHA